MTARIVLPEGAWAVLNASHPPVLPPVWEALGLRDFREFEGDRQEHERIPGEDLVEPLVDAALGEIEVVIQITAPPRDRAFRLLAADALLTWACAYAADSADPGTRLQQVVDRAAAVAS